ncbi:MAG: 3-dehydroquinate synthase [Chloroflexota bacterium]
MRSRIEHGRGYLSRAGSLVGAVGVAGRAFVVTDRNAHAHYGQPLAASLLASGREPAVHILAPGEQTKSFGTAQLLYDWLAEARAERTDCIVALGGGVVGDLAGFVAATYLRGLALVHVPTTLLAQVDSSIGGKTGVNHPRAKNLIGAFYPAALIVIDPATLATLPPREYRAGLGEVVKYGMIMDAGLFDLIESRQADLPRQEEDLVDQVVGRCAQLKQAVVAEDEHETGRRAILNFGHTIGHALEAATNYQSLLHGEAVAIGMSGAARIAVELGKLDPGAYERLKALLKALGLPFAARGLAWEVVREAMKLDKKTRSGRIQWVLPTAIGSCEVSSDVPEEVLVKVLKDLLNA